VESERLVRLAVLSAALIAVIAFGAAFALTASPGVDVEGGRYLGARLLAPGPGIGGLPVIPVRVDEMGFIQGVSSHLDWYSYCRPDMPGLAIDFEGDNRFTYSIGEEPIRQAKAQGLEVWFEPLLGREVQAADFTEDWQGAHVKWRSHGVADPVGQMTSVVLKVPAGTYSEAITSEFAPDGFVAFNTDDTHFCCQVGWRLNTSPKAKTSVREDGEGGFDLLYDSCHDDRYDPRAIQSYDRPPGGEYTLDRRG